MNILEALIQILQQAQRQSADTAFLRDVVADNSKGPMHKMSGVEETNVNKVTVAGAATLDNSGDWIRRGEDRGISRDDQRKRELGQG